MSRAKTSRYPSIRQMHSRVGRMCKFPFRREPSGAIRIWHESWIAGRWLLELILRLLGYAGRYRNRDRLADFDPIEQVPLGLKSKSFEPLMQEVHPPNV